MKSQTKIEKQLQKKRNLNLVQTIIATKKNKAWKRVGEILSNSTRKKSSVNLSDLNDFAKEGETIVVAGKVLSLGEIDKKIKIIALNFSEKAMEKLLKSKIETSNILDTIKKSPKAEGIRVFE